MSRADPNAAYSREACPPSLSLRRVGRAIWYFQFRPRPPRARLPSPGTGGQVAKHCGQVEIENANKKILNILLILSKKENAVPQNQNVLCQGLTPFPLYEKEVFNMEDLTSISPQSLTAVEMLESIDASCRNQALEMLRNFVYEVRSEQKWEELYSNHPGPMREMAKQALKDHKQGKSWKL